MRQLFLAALIAVAGSASTGVNGRIQTMVGLKHDEIFANTFG